MGNGIVLACVLLILVATISCAAFHSMLKSAISLAVISALLAVVLFAMGATWAGVFELSVCSGLITVVFVSAVSLCDPDRNRADKEAEHRQRFAALPFLLIFVGAALIALLVLSDFSVVSTANPAALATSFREVFWNMRQADVLAQIIIILAGAFAVVILFKEGEKE